MPRAFLITHRRYNATMETAVEDSSSDRTLGTAPSTPRPHDASSDDPDCLEELYNLTKLAEVSLAAAAGRLTRYRHLNATTTRRDDDMKDDVAPSPYGYTHKLFDRTSSRRRNDDDDDDVYKSNEESSSCSVDSKARLDDDCTSGDDSFVVDVGAVASTSAAMTTPAMTPPPLQQQDDCHECPDCGKKYSTSSNLARHRQTHRSLADKKARRCPHCDKVYVSMPAFSMHVRTHNQGCRCHFCGKCFSRPWLLQGHIRTHTGEKPFKCSVCAKAFADKSNLRAHVQTHSNTKPHTCARCGKAFALKSYLYKHEESSCMRLHQNASRHAIRAGDGQSSSQQAPPSAPPAPPPPPPPPSVIVTLPRPREYFGARSAFETPSTVIRSPDRPSGSPGRPHDPDAKQRYFETTTTTTSTTHGPNAYERDTVISPNPERLIYCSVQHPSVVLSGASNYGSVCQERPVDFSPATQARQFQ